jgi:lipid II:glycine glycyltransferase (peptidoglycan interpeptide bridge formation enzyme)
MHGLWRFKTGFGGAIVHRAGTVDAPLSPFYGAYRLAEKARTVWYKRLSKLFRR